MKAHKCAACKIIGKNVQANAEHVIWGKKNKSLSIVLCYLHSLELFKTGQMRFLETYKGCVDTKELESKSKKDIFAFR